MKYKAIIQGKTFKIKEKQGLFGTFRTLFETDNEYRWIRQIKELKNQGKNFI